MQALIKKLTDKKSEKFAEQFGEMFKSLPHLPKTWVDLLVRLAPPFTLIGAVLSLIAGPILGILSLFSLITFNPFFVFSVALAAIIMIINSLLLFAAHKFLQKREYKGWLLLFWSDVLGLVHVVFGIFFRHDGPIGAIISALIGFYILFELRPRYKKN